MRWGREGTTVPGPKVFEVEDCETYVPVSFPRCGWYVDFDLGGIGC